MAANYLRRGNPYNTRYAIPGYVRTEPARNAVVTPGSPRGWGSGPIAVVSRGLPNGYVDFNLPPDLAGLGSLEGAGAGGSLANQNQGRDPISTFGRRAAREVLAHTGGNLARIRAALNGIGVGLAGAFDAKIAKGMRPEGALSAVLANRLLERTASGRGGLGDVPPPPGTTGTTTLVSAGAARVRTVDTDGSASSGAAQVKLSPAAASIIARYTQGNPGAVASTGTFTAPNTFNMGDKKAFNIRPVNLLGDDKSRWLNQSSSVANTRWSEVKNGSWWFYAANDLLWFYNPTTKTLQIKSQGANLFEIIAAGIEKGVNFVGSLPGKIAGLACEAVNSPLAQTATILGAGVSGTGKAASVLTNVAKAQGACGAGGGAGGGGDDHGAGEGGISPLLLGAGALLAVLLLGRK